MGNCNPSCDCPADVNQTPRIQGVTAKNFSALAPADPDKMRISQPTLIRRTTSQAEIQNFMSAAAEGVAVTLIKDSGRQDAVYLVEKSSSTFVMLTGEKLERNEHICPMLSISKVGKLIDGTDEVPQVVISKVRPEEVSRCVKVVYSKQNEQRTICFLLKSTTARDEFIKVVSTLSRKSVFEVSSAAS
mmetsp:Transcript_45507/g.71001  ORF Transcript_45507/g.71001 Transcript_45507/m.71001 type:complete len:188 (+) Transcript_45507:96-659(+)